MIIDCLGCLHGTYPKLEGGDLLLLTGDLTGRDSVKEWDAWFHWLDKQQYKKKIYIGGNHDNFLTHCSNNKDCVDIEYDEECSKQEYLCDSEAEFEGLKIWGSPHSLTFQGINTKCQAFTGDEFELEEFYKKIPSDIDILISHTPFYGMLDANRDGYLCGSRTLRDSVDRIKPKIFICSHIHEQGGQQMMYKHLGPNTWCVNCSIMDENYKMKQKPIRITI